MKLYSLISAMTRRDRIMSGVQNYTAEPMLWLARAAGLWDEFRGEMGFDELHPLVSQAYYTFERGAAVELLPRCSPRARPSRPSVRAPPGSDQPPL